MIEKFIKVNTEEDILCIYETLKLKEIYMEDNIDFDNDDVESTLLEEVENKGFLIMNNF